MKTEQEIKKRIDNLKFDMRSNPLIARELMENMKELEWVLS
jgi:hypothetical protein